MLEQFLNNIIDQSPHPIWISDNKGTLIRINKSCLKLLNLKEEEVVNKYNLFNDEIVAGQGLVPLIRTVYEEGKNISFNLEYNTKDLKQLSLEQTAHVFLEVTMSPVKDEKGNVTNAIIMHRDITSQKKLENQLLHSQKMEAIGLLAGGIAHDFNNMLGVILGHLELIKSVLPEDHTVMHNITAIEKAGLHSRDIIKQLLAFSRKQIIQPRILNLNNAIASIKKTLFKLIGENITLQFKPGDNLWNIEIDPSQLNQILINLAINSRDAMTKGGNFCIKTINITVDKDSKREYMELNTGDYVYLKITDNGTGIKTDIITHIFEPFFTTKESGTGLGLSTVYGIVKQNNGIINVNSEPGKGTAFHIYFPRSFEKAAEETQKENNFTEKHSGNILLVEDENLVRSMLTAVLESLGYNVLLSPTPEEALIYLKEKDHVDLLITDIVMPNMNGPELYSHASEFKQNLKVLFMSGYSETAEYGKIINKDNFIQKPFSIKDFSKKILSILNRD